VRVVILGARGQLGRSFREALADHDVLALRRNDLDICDSERVLRLVQDLRPDVVINTAAVRRPDACEDQPARAFDVNALGARNVALACARSAIALLHISTDNVFDGRKAEPYVEEDAPNPITTYGVTKLAGEFFVRNLVDKLYIVRTSGLFGGLPADSSNFVLTILRQSREGQVSRVVTDQFISPSYTLDVARKCAWLLTTNAYGLYHVTNAGACSWFEFAQAIFERCRLTSELQPTTTEALGLRAARLRYAVLANGALRRVGADDLPSWRDALDRYIAEIERAEAVPV
jgi:dTDP-4-dehydrorhamnose reductase